MGKSGIIRIAKRARYVIVTKTIAEDATISDRARGLLLRLLAKPDDWTIMVDSLHRGTVEGRDAMRTAWKELVAAGYARRERQRGPDGQLEGVKYWIDEGARESCDEAEDADVTPCQSPHAGNPAAGIPAAGNPDAGNPTLQKTQLQKTKKQKNKNKGEGGGGSALIRTPDDDDVAALRVLIDLHGQDAIDAIARELYLAHTRRPFVSEIEVCLRDTAEAREADEREKAKVDAAVGKLRDMAKALLAAKTIDKSHWTIARAKEAAEAGDMAKLAEADHLLKCVYYAYTPTELDSRSKDRQRFMRAKIEAGETPDRIDLSVIKDAFRSVDKTA